MIDIRRRVSTLKYVLGLYPSVWQLPNAVKIYEYLEIAKGLNANKNLRILDLGCGRGLQTQLLARNAAHVTGIEPDPKRFQLALRDVRSSRVKNKIEFVNGTLEDATLEEGTLDRAVSFCVLEHIPNLDEVLAKIFKLLRSGGELHATVDSLGNMDDQALIEKHRKEHAVVQYFTLDTIEETLNRAGFVVTEKRHFLTSPLAKAKLIAELETGNYLDPIELRKKRVQDLAEAESRITEPSGGTMILVRARKPENGAAPVQNNGRKEN
jgi:2-polyprenyl-3-methyl-5-hydroxy-6-metoxy-1,4-benzoquinol methylase